MDPNLILGRFELVSSDNLEPYMQRLGLGFLTRKLANRTNMTITFGQEEGDRYSMKTETPIKNFEVKFKLGEQFEEVTGDGRRVLNTVTMKAPDVMVQEMLGTGGGVDSVCTRTFLRYGAGARVGAVTGAGAGINPD